MFDGSALTGQLGGFATWVSPGPIDWVAYCWLPGCQRRWLRCLVEASDQISVSLRSLVLTVDRGQSRGCRLLLASC